MQRHHGLTAESQRTAAPRVRIRHGQPTRDQARSGRPEVAQRPLISTAWAARIEIQTPAQTPVRASIRAQFRRNSTFVLPRPHLSSIVSKIGPAYSLDDANRGRWQRLYRFGLSPLVSSGPE